MTPIKAIARSPQFIAAVLLVYLLLSAASMVAFGPVLLGSTFPEIVTGPVRTIMLLAGAVFGFVVFLFALRLSLLPVAVALGDGFHIGALQDRTRGNSLRLFTNYFVWGLILVVTIAVATLLLSLPLNFVQSLLSGDDGTSVAAAVPGVIWHVIRLSILMVANGSLAIFASLAYERLSKIQQEESEAGGH